jgi:hypothetical protein
MLVSAFNAFFDRESQPSNTNFYEVQILQYGQHICTQRSLCGSEKLEKLKPRTP